jgi:hypothetical protein
MKKVLFVATLVLAFATFGVSTAFAQGASGCPTGGEEIGSAGGTTESGVEVTIDGPTVTFSEEVEFCVKAGPEDSGVQVGTTFTVDWTVGSGQTPNISHVVVYEVTGGDDGDGGPGGDTTDGGPGGDTTDGGPGGDTTTDGDATTGDDVVDGGDVSPGDGDDTAGTTGAATGGPTGGTTGGTTGGAPTPTGGNLPFTGLPVWVPLLVAFALLGSGFVLLRRKGHVS